MNNINPIDIEMRETQFSRRHHRLLVIGSALIVLYCFLAGSIFSLLKVPFGYGEIIPSLLVMLISFVCQYRLYHLNATRIANVSEQVIDERQRMVRHAAYQRAYYILLWTVGIIVPAAFTFFFVSPHFFTFAFGFYIGLLWLMVLLPTWVIAWTE